MRAEDSNSKIVYLISKPQGRKGWGILVKSTEPLVTCVVSRPNQALAPPIPLVAVLAPAPKPLPEPKLVRVNDVASSPIETSSRRSISLDQNTAASGSCAVKSKRSSSPT